ncbi:MAG: glycosyltransferase family 4 protein [Candidatus Omnitrophica bacterium]|nr:glycosyltransferase family 4 protein [Candidatus Omnitrophota bacterium]
MKNLKSEIEGLEKRLNSKSPRNALKILMLNYEFPPVGGGAGVATYNIAKELAAMGHVVDVITSRIKGQKRIEALEGFTVYRVFSLRKGIHDCGFRGAVTYVFFAFFVFIRLIASNKYDVIHYFFSFPTGLLALWPGLHRRVPYVVSLRGSDVPLYDVHNKMLQFMHCLLLPITRMVWRRADTVVALSKSLRETAHKTAPSQAMDVIPNGINTEHFAPRPSGGRDTSSLQLISVARLIERKGIQHILRALSVLNDPNIRLTIAGLGNYEAELRRLCSKLGLIDRVTFYGYCERKYLPALYNSADIFVLPSLAESFGIVFAEAMSCGLPIIGAREGGIPDLVDEQNGILVEPGDHQALAQAIRILKNDPERRCAMGIASRNKIREHYSWRMIARKYEECYKNILKV